MGAFIGYLYRRLGVRHVFVLAPELTIYDTLVRDFTLTYVLQGLREFAPPLSVGDNYESRAPARQLAFASVDINTFNISKTSAEVRGGRASCIKAAVRVPRVLYYARTPSGGLEIRAC